MLRYAIDVQKPVNAMHRIILYALTALKNADVVHRIVVKWRRFKLPEITPLWKEDGPASWYDRIVLKEYGYL